MRALPLKTSTFARRRKVLAFKASDHNDLVRPAGCVGPHDGFCDVVDVGWEASEGFFPCLFTEEVGVAESEGGEVMMRKDLSCGGAVAIGIAQDLGTVAQQHLKTSRSAGKELDDMDTSGGAVSELLV